MGQKEVVISVKLIICKNSGGSLPHSDCLVPGIADPCVKSAPMSGGGKNNLKIFLNLLSGACVHDLGLKGNIPARLGNCMQG